MSDKQPVVDSTLKAIITVVASLVLLISLLASIAGKNGEFERVALVFGSVAALVFGGNIFKKTK